MLDDNPTGASARESVGTAWHKPRKLRIIMGKPGPAQKRGVLLMLLNYE
jgi:hypothetical protein